MLRRQRRQLRGHLLMSTQRQVGVDPQLQRRGAQLLQPGAITTQRTRRRSPPAPAPATSRAPPATSPPPPRPAPSPSSRRPSATSRSKRTASTTSGGDRRGDSPTRVVAISWPPAHRTPAAVLDGACSPRTCTAFSGSRISRSPHSSSTIRPADTTSPARSPSSASNPFGLSPRTSTTPPVVVQDLQRSQQPKLHPRSLRPAPGGALRPPANPQPQQATAPPSPRH